MKGIEPFSVNMHETVHSRFHYLLQLSAFLVAGCTTIPQENQTPETPCTVDITTISADNKEYPVYLAAPSTAKTPRDRPPSLLQRP